jgi:aspartyl-tRNA(Asn)/glutamyl-tRNA(Gln) amidotransferase subunit C
MMQLRKVNTSPDIMTIDKALVSRIANLARIRVTEEEKETLSKELGSIMGWIGQLNEVDTSNVAPLTSVVETTLPMREDKVTDGNNPEAILANAPKEAAGFFVVPKVVE